MQALNIKQIRINFWFSVISKIPAKYSFFTHRKCFITLYNVIFRSLYFTIIIKFSYILIYITMLLTVVPHLYPHHPAYSIVSILFLYFSLIQFIFPLCILFILSKHTIFYYFSSLNLFFLKFRGGNLSDATTTQTTILLYLNFYLRGREWNISKVCGKNIFLYFKNLFLPHHFLCVFVPWNFFTLIIYM